MGAHRLVCKKRESGSSYGGGCERVEDALSGRDRAKEGLVCRSRVGGQGRWHVEGRGWKLGVESMQPGKNPG